MAALSDERIGELLAPYIDEDTAMKGRMGELLPKFSTYLDLLLRWNARTNLTAIREPEQIVQRHFGESVFAAGELIRGESSHESILDFGSGAGFPGIPMQLRLPEVRVCLGESQGKKAAFLREAVRTLGLRSDVWAGRVEDLPHDQAFDVVTLRAVDRMEAALKVASKRVKADGHLVVLAGSGFKSMQGWEVNGQRLIPQSAAEFVYIVRHA